MELAAELAVGSELDVDALVEAEPYQIQRLLHRDLLLRRRHHRRPLLQLPAPKPLNPSYRTESQLPLRNSDVLAISVGAAAAPALSFGYNVSRPVFSWALLHGH